MFNVLMGGNTSRLNAVDFDGSTYMLRGSDLSGNADSSRGTLSFWWRFDATGARMAMLMPTAGTGGFTCDFDSTGRLSLQLADATASSSVIMNTTSAPGAGTWNHVMASWDTNFAAGARLTHLYLDGSSNKTVVTDSGSAFNIDYTRDNWGFASDVVTNAQRFNGCISEFYFSPGQYLDLSVSANRLKFRTADGKPAVLGESGSLPTGTPPIIYFRNASDLFNINLGTGGNFVVTSGTITSCSSTPA